MITLRFWKKSATRPLARDHCRSEAHDAQVGHWLLLQVCQVVVAERHIREFPTLQLGATLHEPDNPCCGNLGPVQVERFEPLQRHRVGQAGVGDAKRVRRLMAIMDLEAVHPRPRTTTAAPEARAYPSCSAIGS
jgi:hypothetical protein